MKEITRVNHTDNEVVCEDADGDGYYFWGLGLDQRPASCPLWAPLDADGDDSNYRYGPMAYSGALLDLESLASQTLIITSDTTINTRTYLYNNVIVTNSGKLTIKADTHLYGQCTITAESGGQIVIDGCALENGSLVLNSQSSLTIKNGGMIIMREGTDFNVPIGAHLDMECGDIK